MKILCSALLLFTLFLPPTVYAQQDSVRVVNSIQARTFIFGGEYDNVCVFRNRTYNDLLTLNTLLFCTDDREYRLSKGGIDVNHSIAYTDTLYAQFYAGENITRVEINNIPLTILPVVVR